MFKKIMIRDIAALQWLSKNGYIIKALIPKFDNEKSVYPGRKISGRIEIFSSYDFVIVINENWLDLFASAPEKIKKAAIRTFNSENVPDYEINKKDLINIPKNTLDIQQYLIDQTNKKVDDVEKQIINRKDILSKNKFFYHCAPAGKKKVK